MKEKKLLCTLLAAFSVTACTKVNIDTRSTEGEVNISADWDGQTAPAGLCFYFYRTGDASASTRAEAATENPLIRNVGATGFTGTLPIGTYRALAVNTDATGVEIQDMGSVETAAVAMKEGAFPTSLYALSTEELNVDGTQKIAQSCMPRQLTKTLKLTFSLEGAGVRSLSGTIAGLYPSLLIATGEPTEAARNAAPQTRRGFEATLDGETGSAEMRLLGILDPQDGDRYRNVLVLEATTQKGETLGFNVDLSATLTEILTAGGGTLPVRVPVEVEIEVAAGGTAGFTARVASWTQGNGNGEVEDR